MNEQKIISTFYHLEKSGVPLSKILVEANQGNLNLADFFKPLDIKKDETKGFLNILSNVLIDGYENEGMIELDNEAIGLSREIINNSLTDEFTRLLLDSMVKIKQSSDQLVMALRLLSEAKYVKSTSPASFSTLTEKERADLQKIIEHMIKSNKESELKFLIQIAKEKRDAILLEYDAIKKEALKIMATKEEKPPYAQEWAGFIPVSKEVEKHVYFDIGEKMDADTAKSKNIDKMFTIFEKDVEENKKLFSLKEIGRFLQFLLYLRIDEREILINVIGEIDTYINQNDVPENRVAMKLLYKNYILLAETQKFLSFHDEKKTDFKFHEALKKCFEFPEFMGDVIKKEYKKQTKLITSEEDIKLANLAKQVKQRILRKGIASKTYDLSKIAYPRSLDEIYGHKDLVAMLKREVSLVKEGFLDTYQNFFFAGPAGTGKSMVADVFAQAMIRANGEEVSDETVVNVQLKDFKRGELRDYIVKRLRYMPLVKEGGRPFKVFKYDEFEQITSDGISGLKMIFAAAFDPNRSKYGETYVPAIHILMTNDVKNFLTPPEKAIKQITTHLIKQKGLPYEVIEANLTWDKYNIKQIMSWLSSNADPSAYTDFTAAWEASTSSLFNEAFLSRFTIYVFPQFTVDQKIDFVKTTVASKLKARGEELLLTDDEIRKTAESTISIRDLLTELTRVRAGKILEKGESKMALVSKYLDLIVLRPLFNMIINDYLSR